MILTALLLSLGGAAGGTEFEPLAGPAPQNYSLFDRSWDVMDPPSLFAEGLGPWPIDATLAQGYFGVHFVDHAQLDGGTIPPVDLDDEALATLPTIGGGMQYKLGGKYVSWGLEGMIDFAGRADALAFYSGSGGALVAIDADLASLGLGGGPFLSVFLNDRLRAYVAGGALMQWTWYDQTGATDVDTFDGDGFGTGWYSRAGSSCCCPTWPRCWASGAAGRTRPSTSRAAWGTSTCGARRCW
jgi:hypothetical protein